jgi:hypothetical protein
MAKVPLIPDWWKDPFWAPGPVEGEPTLVIGDTVLTRINDPDSGEELDVFVQALVDEWNGRTISLEEGMRQAEVEAKRLERKRRRAAQATARALKASHSSSPPAPHQQEAQR